MNSILVLFLLCVSTAGVFAEEGIKEFNEYIDECTKQAGVDRKIFDEVMFKNGDTTEEKVKCVFLCINEKSGYVKNGEIDKEKMKKGELPSFVPEDRKKEISEKMIKCADTPGTNSCDTAYQIHKCMAKKE